MKYTSPLLAASIVAILVYAIMVKKSPEQQSPRRMEIGTISEAPRPLAPLAPTTLASESTKAAGNKKVATKSKPKHFKFAKRFVSEKSTDKELTSVTGMTAAATDYNLTPADADKALKLKTARNIINPADSRWISELSGERAKLKMGLERADLSCDDDYRRCERPEGNNEVLLGGMVVKAERLLKNPSHSIDGKLVRGHYAKKTPAVYVK